MAGASDVVRRGAHRGESDDLEEQREDGLGLGAGEYRPGSVDQVVGCDRVLAEGFGQQILQLRAQGDQNRPDEVGLGGEVVHDGPVVGTDVARHPSEGQGAQAIGARDLHRRGEQILPLMPIPHAQKCSPHFKPLVL
jgi:hypothetical protein